MIKYICLLAFFVSPLMAYTFGTYYNFKTENNQGNSYRVATVSIDEHSFKTYVEVSLVEPRTVCALIGFGAITQETWNGADILALTLSPNGTIVRIYDLIGDAGTNSIKAKSEIQDWKLMAKGIDTSYTYDNNLWRAEAQRNYTKIEKNINYNVNPPGSSGWSPVAINVFEGACPTAAYNFTTLPIVGGWVFYRLKPTNSNVSLLHLLGWYTVCSAIFITN